MRIGRSPTQRPGGLPVRADAAGARTVPTASLRHRGDRAAADPPWIPVASPGQAKATTIRMSWRPVVIEISIAALVVFLLVGAAGVLAAYRVAEQEAITTALRACDLLSRSALEPVLSDEIVPPATAPRTTVPGLPASPSPVFDDPSPTPEQAAALSRVDHAVRMYILSSTVVQVKLWTPDGRIIYSDAAQLIGQRFPLDDTAQHALDSDATIGSVSDPNAPDDQFERADGKLLEVYRPVRTPSGQQLLFETYSRYDALIAHSGQMWLGISLIAVGSLLLMHVLWVPLSWVLVSRLRQARRQRDMLLDRALSASDEERRRIAGTLHDGVVQDLAATSFVVASSAQQAQQADQTQLANRLETAAAGVRASIGALRSLLVDIYPPNLNVAGLSATLADLASSLQARGMQVVVAEDPGLDLEPALQSLIYRVAQECLRNAGRHAQASQATVRISRNESVVRLDVVDNGIGFDPAETLGNPAEGHFGVQVMRDLAIEHNARLAVRSRIGAGTQWRLEVNAGVA